MDKRLASGRRKFDVVASEETAEAALLTGESGEILEVGPSVPRLLGFGADELVGRSLLDLVHPDDVGTVETLLAESGGRPWEQMCVETRLRRPSGQFRFVELRCVNHHQDPSIKARVISVLDVGHRKEAERLIRESERRLRAILGTSLDAVVSIQADGLIVGWDGQAEEVFGWNRSEMIGRPAAELLVPPELRDQFQELLQDYLRTWVNRVLGRRGEFEAFHRSGRRLTVEVAVAPIHGPDGVTFTGFIRDVTDRQKLLDSLRRQAERFRLLVENVPAILWSTDRQLRLTSASGAELARIGLTSEEFVGRPLTEILGPDAPPSLVASIRLALEGEPADVEVELFGRAYQTHLEPLAIPGLEHGVIGVSLDVTDRRAVERELLESQAHLIALFENTVDMIFAVGRDRRLLTFNTSFSEMFHRTHGRNPVAGEVLTAELLDADQDFWWSQLKRAFEGEQFNILFETVAVGQPLVYDLSFGPILERGSISGVSIVGRDVTARRREEQEASELRRRFTEGLVRAEENERRRIARELHDESGQSLASLSLGLRMVEEAGTLEQARAEASRLRGIASHAAAEIRRVAHGLHPALLDDLGLVAALRKSAAEIAAAGGLKAAVHADTLGAKRLPPVLERGLYRIAQEAMTNVLKHAAASSVDIILLRLERSIRLLVEDDGVGFDPARGLGREGSLGLVGMHERASLLGGTLAFESAPGCGTTISVEVPLEAGGAADAAPRPGEAS